MAKPHRERDDSARLVRSQSRLDDIRIRAQQERDLTRMWLDEQRCVDLRWRWEREEIGIFPLDGRDPHVCVLQVGSCVAFKGCHPVPAEVVVDYSAIDYKYII